MIRNLKVLGLALAAVFALSAVVASAASAQVGTITSTGPVTLDGTQTGLFGSGANALTATFGGNASKIECEKAIYTGHKYKETPHKFIPNDVSTVTITPHYGTCAATVPPIGTVPATVDMNECDYVLHLTGTVPGIDTYEVSATVICPAGKHITVTLFSNAVNHAANKPFCHVTILQKATDYTGLTATDTTNGHIDISGVVPEIVAEKSTGVLCSPAQTDNNAKLDLDITVNGTNEKGEKTNISISHL